MPNLLKKNSSKFLLIFISLILLQGCSFRSPSPLEQIKNRQVVFYNAENFHNVENVSADGVPSEQRSTGGGLLQVASADSPQAPLVAKLKKISEKPLSGEETKEVMKEVTGNFLLGPGLGETAIDIAGIALFPPYAIALIGNSLLSLGGYEQLSIQRALPDDAKDDYLAATDAIYSAPGRILSFVTGNEYRDREQIKKRWEDVVNELEENRKDSDNNTAVGSRRVSATSAHQDEDLLKPLPISIPLSSEKLLNENRYNST